MMFLADNSFEQVLPARLLGVLFSVGTLLGMRVAVFIPR
jgi:hypothetical protein